MKTIILALAFLPALAHADVQSALQRLDAANAQLQSAQAQIGAAQTQILAAKQELLQQSTPGMVCIYSYFGKQYTGRGASESEATENAIFDCARDPDNSRNSGDCRYWSNKNGNTLCRSTN